MPTEAQVEAAIVAFSDAMEGSSFRDNIRAALTAAEAVVSEEDAALAAEIAAPGAVLCLYGPNQRALTANERHTVVDALARRDAGQAVPDGLVLVPKEPTHEMLDRFIDLALKEDGFSNGLKIANPKAGYLAMLAAAPKAPVSDEAAIRADERERLATMLDERAKVNEAGDWLAAASAYREAAKAIRAATPKPKDKA